MARGNTVVAPDGRTWTVGRQWISARIRLRRGREREVPNGGGSDGGGDDWSMADLFGFDEVTPSALAIGLAIALVAALLLLVVLPLVALVLDLLLLLVVLVVGVTSRVVLRRPWQIVAETSGPPPESLSWQVVGWRASGRAITEIRRSLAVGELPQRATAGSSVADTIGR